MSTNTSIHSATRSMVGAHRRPFHTTKSVHLAKALARELAKQ